MITESSADTPSTANIFRADGTQPPARVDDPRREAYCGDDHPSAF
jgi:hypothetical protein